MESDREITLGDIGGTIWRGKWYVVLAAVLGGVIGLLLTFTGATTYTASSQVYLGQATTMMGNLAQTAGTNPLTAATVLQGDVIVDEVAAKTGLTRGQVRSDSDISVSRAPGTTNTNQPAIAQITAHTDTADRSIALANTYADVALGGANAGYAVVVKTLEGQVRTGQAAVLRLTGQLKGAGTNQGLVASELATQQTNLATAQLQLARVQQIEAPSVVSKATSASSSSSSRNRVRTIVIGAVIGLLLGLVVALIIGGSRRRGASTA